MAIRRVYYIEDNKVKYHDFDIKWYGGFAISQKKKNVDQLHGEISVFFAVDKEKILEVSTKSEKELGKKLSSFNLIVENNDVRYSVESVYQSSKVFKNIFKEYQHEEVLKMSPHVAKKIVSKEDHRTLIKFKCFDKDFSLIPKHMFYDWLVIKSLNNINGLIYEISKYSFFTDIEFNPKQSINCQARSLTLFIWLNENGKVEDYLNNPVKYYRSVK